MGAGGLDPAESTEAYNSNEVELQFGDGHYWFKLKLKQLAELQEKCKAGIGAIYVRVEVGEYYALDLIEVIRLGLIGGGRGTVNGEEVRVTPELANKLVERYCDRPLLELWEIAKSIYRVVMHGYASEDKNDSKEQNARKGQELDGSTSPQPMQTESGAEGLAPTK